ncbi:MAG: hypothetical protein ACFCU1_09645 [Sumerlaeia bacterium]
MRQKTALTENLTSIAIVAKCISQFSGSQTAKSSSIFRLAKGEKQKVKNWG